MEDQPAADKNPDLAADGSSQWGWLAVVYDTHAARLYQYALMILANPSAAEDVVQQVFVKLASTGRQIHEISSLNGYLRTSVRNECYRVFRRNRPRHLPDKCSRPMLSTVEEKADDEGLRPMIEQALRTLPADQREVIHMKVYEGMTFQQISDALSISINTAASRYRYAIEKLQHQLRPYYKLEDQRND